MNDALTSSPVLLAVGGWLLINDKKLTDQSLIVYDSFCHIKVDPMPIFIKTLKYLPRSLL
jgi:hypothetical protein